MFSFKNQIQKKITCSKKGLNSFKTNYLNFNQKPQFKFSSFDNFFSRNRFPFTYYLIGTNVFVFCLNSFNLITPRVYYEHFTLGYHTIQNNYYHNLITHCFAHANIMHLAANMLGLYFFGTFMERQFGPKRLAKLYLGGALLGGIFILLDAQKKKLYQVHLGASSSVNSIITNFIFNFPQMKIYLYFLFPIPAWVFGSLVILYDLFYFGKKDGVSHQGHLGGILFGALAYALLKK